MQLKTVHPVLSSLSAADHYMGGGCIFFQPVIPEKVVFTMEAKIYVGNLAKSTSLEDLNTLFAQAGQVLFVDMIKDRNSGEPKGFAFITMSAQSEADKAISMFNAYSLGDQELKVDLAKPREQRGFDTRN